MRALKALGVVALVVGACGPPEHADAVATMEAYLANRVRNENFSGSVLVAVDGVPILSRGYGLANREHGVPCTPQTKYRLGSITKPIAAIAILQLVERGLVDLHTPVEEYVHDLPEQWRGMTLHHILSHQTGMPIDPRREDRPILTKLATRPRETMHQFADTQLEFPPGEGVLYTNGGFMLASVIIEDLTGQRWEDFMRESVFAPAGMRDSGHDTHAAILPHRASGYRKRGRSVRHADYYEMDFAIGGGDLYSTVEDLLRLDGALYNDVLLSAESREAMFTHKAGPFGYGWRLGDQFGRRISHGGGINGFQAQFSRFPDERVTVIVLCNNEWSSPEHVARNLASILFKGTYQGSERAAGD
jgi:CubicO group peptidase (beta-lactamase class C family)